MLTLAALKTRFAYGDAISGLNESRRLPIAATSKLIRRGTQLHKIEVGGALCLDK